eukprot:114698_1
MNLVSSKINIQCQKVVNFIKSVGKKKSEPQHNSPSSPTSLDSLPLPGHDQFSVSSMDEEDIFISCDNEYSISDCSRSYKFLSAKETRNKPPPIYQPTHHEHDILRKAWNTIRTVDEARLYEEYKEILDNDRHFKLILIRNGVAIQEQFDLLFEAFDQIINATDHDMIATTATVLKLIGIRQANIYKIIPCDYTEFGCCFCILFEKYLYQYFRAYPQSKVLMTKCWQFIFESVTFAFDVED